RSCTNKNLERDGALSSSHRALGGSLSLSCQWPVSCTGHVSIKRLESRHDIPVLRMLAEKIDNKAATGDHLLTIGADDIQRAFHQLGGNSAAAQTPRRLGVGDDDCLRRQPVIGKGDLTLGVELEAVQGLVVANGRHARKCPQIDRLTSRWSTIPSLPRRNETGQGAVRHRTHAYSACCRRGDLPQPLSRFLYSSCLPIQALTNGQSAITVMP